MLDSIFNSNKTKIGIMKVGGIGDALTLLFLTHAIKRKYPESVITLYVRDKNEFCRKDPAVNNVVFTGNCGYDLNKLTAREAKRYDLFFDDRYLVGTWVKGELTLEGEDKKTYWDFFNKLNSFKGNLLKMSAKTAGVKLIEEDYSLNFVINNNKLERLVNYPYILLNGSNGYLRATKAYPSRYWKALVKMIRKDYHNIEIIQVGTKQETKIEGTLDLRGQTTFEELCSLSRKAELIICSEGILNHISKAFNTKAIVLFGATSKDNFGYKENINIEGKKGCSGCWYSTPLWYANCPISRQSYCSNIETITPDEILKKLHTLLQKQ